MDSQNQRHGNAETSNCRLCGKVVQIPRPESCVYGDQCDNFCKTCWPKIQGHVRALEEAEWIYIEKLQDIRNHDIS